MNVRVHVSVSENLHTKEISMYKRNDFSLNLCTIPKISDTDYVIVNCFFFSIAKHFGLYVVLSRKKEENFKKS